MKTTKTDTLISQKTFCFWREFHKFNVWITKSEFISTTDPARNPETFFVTSNFDMPRRSVACFYYSVALLSSLGICVDDNGFIGFPKISFVVSSIRLSFSLMSENDSPRSSILSFFYQVCRFLNCLWKQTEKNPLNLKVLNT